MSRLDPVATGTAPRPLTKQEIDRRIESVLAVLADDDGTLAPRPISSREIVRRVAPLVSWN